jgi:hypothetical protein
MTMSNHSQFVILTNPTDKTLFLRPPRKAPAPGEVQLRETIPLEPGTPSHPLPFDLVSHASNWKSLINRSHLAVQKVKFEPPFVRVKNLSETPVHLELVLPVVLEPGQLSAPLCRAGLRNLKSVARVVSVEPVGHIGPPVHSQGEGSLGSEPVYICYECGGPIVFRTNGQPHPIHI